MLYEVITKDGHVNASFQRYISDLLYFIRHGESCKDGRVARKNHPYYSWLSTSCKEGLDGLRPGDALPCSKKEVFMRNALLPQRVRTINGSFAYIEHRFLRHGFWASLAHHELLLYFFLVMVADSRITSYNVCYTKLLREVVPVARNISWRCSKKRLLRLFWLPVSFTGRKYLLVR